jgi:arylsulfatase A-like enzyme
MGEARDSSVPILASPYSIRLAIRTKKNQETIVEHQRLNRRDFLKRSAALSAAAIAAPGAVMASRAQAQARPNIVVIMVDDMGYGDAGCYGSETIATPNIDAIADHGIRFTDFCAAGSWCVPSRKGLLTGVHPYRPGMGKRGLGEKTTMAEMLKAQGYATAIMGKWHLGLGEGLHPLDQGFDYYYGTPGSNDAPAPKGKSQNYDVFQAAKEEDWPIPLIRNRERIEFPAKQTLFTQRYTKESIAFIKDNRENPFFLYLAHNMPHVPIYASDDFKGKSKGGLYGDVIEELDWSVGEVVKTLRDEGLLDNTLLVFTSDNGPWSMFKEFGGSAHPLRGEKGTGWEGGSGVPAIFHWPGKIEPGVSPAFMINLDIYATVAAITGSALPTDYQLDSLDMSGVLFRGEASPRENYLFYSSYQYDGPFSYRSGDYKIHVRSNDILRDPITGADAPITHYDPPLLFNLVKDRSETKNIAAEEPEVLRRMTEEFRTAVVQITGKPWADYDRS